MWYDFTCEMLREREIEKYCLSREKGFLLMCHSFDSREWICSQIAFRMKTTIRKEAAKRDTEKSCNELEKPRQLANEGRRRTTRRSKERKEARSLDRSQERECGKRRRERWWRTGNRLRGRGTPGIPDHYSTVSPRGELPCPWHEGKVNLVARYRHARTFITLDINSRISYQEDLSF